MTSVVRLNGGFDFSGTEREVLAAGWLRTPFVSQNVRLERRFPGGRWFCAGVRHGMLEAERSGKKDRVSHFSRAVKKVRCMNDGAPTCPVAMDASLAGQSG